MEKLAVIWEQLADVERTVLLEIAERLLGGQHSYGELSLTKKDWVKERYEEELDRCVYEACETLRRRERND